MFVVGCSLLLVGCYFVCVSYNLLFGVCVCSCVLRDARCVRFVEYRLVRVIGFFVDSCVVVCWLTSVVC